MGDKRSIGGFQKRTEPFAANEILLHSGDTVYMATDGITDQNGPDGSKYGRAQLLSLVKEYRSQSMEAFGEALAKSLDEFQAGVEQRDDITVLGFRM